MKKLFIIFLVTAIAISFYGCKKAEIEKNPEVIPQDPKSTEPVIDKNGALVNTDGEDNADDADNPDIEIVKYTIEIEGMQEEINGKEYHSNLGYKLIYDFDRFQVSSSEQGSDIYMADNPDPELYPYTYININRYDSDTWINDKKDLWTKVKTFDRNVNGYIATEQLEDTIIGDYEAKHYKLALGSDWNSIINHYYVIEHGDYYYTIETQYFLEAAEGYGARMQAMMDTFTLDD